VVVSSGQRNTVEIEQRIDAPTEKVASYIEDFRNAKEWMVGVESVDKLGERAYRLKLESPVGRIEPEVEVIEQSPGRMRWVYVSTVEGGGEVVVTPETGGCVVSYTGEFWLKGGILSRAVQAIGMERFARKNGERSLLRLKHLMEARRY
jgi:carbon monoxide dehydrogenase subunit G